MNISHRNKSTYDEAMKRKKNLWLEIKDRKEMISIILYYLLS